MKRGSLTSLCMIGWGGETEEMRDAVMNQAWGEDRIPTALLGCVLIGMWGGAVCL